MTHKPLRRIEPDGTHVYEGYERYKPLSDAERKNKRRKPDDPRAVRFHTKWYLPLELLPDDDRVMPVTVADVSRDWPKHAKRKGFV